MLRIVPSMTSLKRIQKLLPTWLPRGTRTESRN